MTTTMDLILIGYIFSPWMAKPFQPPLVAGLTAGVETTPGNNLNEAALYLFNKYTHDLKLNVFFIVIT